MSNYSILSKLKNYSKEKKKASLCCIEHTRRGEEKNHHNLTRSLVVCILRYLFCVHTHIYTHTVDFCFTSAKSVYQKKKKKKNFVSYSRKRRKKRKNGVVIVHRRPMVKSPRREIQLDICMYA